MKKTLADRLRERTETIEFRTIVKLLQGAAQRKQNSYRVAAISEPTILMLENEGIKVERINEYGFDKILLTW